MSAAVAGWVASPALEELVRAFGGISPSGSPEVVLERLERFSRRWDARAGGERDDTRWPVHDDGIDALVRTSAHALGLAGRQRPTAARYDHLLVLGGGVRTSLARAHFTAELLDEELVEVPAISGLGSMRALGGRELAAAADYAMPGLASEADAVGAALERTLHPVGPSTQRAGVTEAGEAWRVQTHRAGERRLHVLAAPSSRPGQRANTADTLVGWAELVVRPTAEDRLLVVTTDLFVPFQHCDAVRTLGLRYGCGVETIGVDAAANAWVTPRTSAAVLQEVRSAILSMQRLLRALPGGTRGS